MSSIIFPSVDLDEKEIKIDLRQKMKDVCKIYSDEINKNLKTLVFLQMVKNFIKR